MKYKKTLILVLTNITVLCNTHSALATWPNTNIPSRAIPLDQSSRLDLAEHVTSDETHLTVSSNENSQVQVYGPHSGDITPSLHNSTVNTLRQHLGNNNLATKCISQPFSTLTDCEP